MNISLEPQSKQTISFNRLVNKTNTEYFYRGAGVSRKLGLN